MGLPSPRVALVLAAILASCGKREIRGSPGDADAQDDPGIDVAEAVDPGDPEMALDPDLPDTLAEPDTSEPDATDCSLAPDLETSHWILRVGGSGDEIPYDLAVKPDGSIAVVGHQYSLSESRPFMFTVDGLGNVADGKLIGGLAANSPVKVIALDDCGLLLAGTTTGSGAGGKDIWLAKLDERGAIVWQKTIGEAGDEDLPVVIQTAGGGYFMTATIQSLSFGQDLWLVKLDPDASIAWQERLGNIYEEYPAAAAEGPDGTLYALSRLPSEWPVQYDAGILSLDPGGGIRWQKAIGDATDDGLSAMVVDGTEIICSGQYSRDLNAWIVKLDASSGDLVWNKAYVVGDGRGSASDVIGRGDGGCYVCGSHDIGTTSINYQQWLASIDPDGTIAWQVFIGRDQEQTAYHLGLHVDGLLVVGKEVSSSSDIWMARLGLDGTFSGECPLVSPATVAAIDLPATLRDTGYVLQPTAAIVQETDAIVLTDVDVPGELLCP